MLLVPPTCTVIATHHLCLCTLEQNFYNMHNAVMYLLSPASFAVLMSCHMQLHSENETQMLDLTQSSSQASLAKLRALLEDGDVVKVFHDCRQDAEQLYRHHAIKLQNIFDTRVGAAVAELCLTAP